MNGKLDEKIVIAGYLGWIAAIILLVVLNHV